MFHSGGSPMNQQNEPFSVQQVNTKQRLSSVVLSPKTTLLLALLAYFVSFDYGLCRSTVETLYNKCWDGKLYIVWLATALVMMLVVVFYNRLALRVDLWKIFRGVLLISGLMLPPLVFSLSSSVLRDPYFVPTSFMKAVTFLLEMWKDLYIILLVEIFWTFTSLVSHAKDARWRYGLFVFLGTFGDFGGNALSKQLIILKGHAVGGLLPLWATLPAFAITYLLAWLLSRLLADFGPIIKTKESTPRLMEGVSLASRNSYLLYMIVAIALFQIVMGFLDTQFSVLLNKIPNQHLFKNNIYLYLTLGTMFFGLLSILILKPNWVGGPLIGVPLVLLVGVGIALRIPGIWPVALTYAAGKCFGYSIFRSAKEMLYLPLSPIEKIQGKSLIDMVVYRFGKALAGLFLLPMYALGFQRHLPWVTIGLICVWLGVTVLILIRYHRLIKQGKEPLALKSK